jgi:hypothetical protein
MSVLKDTTCPKCGELDALTICAWTTGVNCSCCFEFIRLLNEKERKLFVKKMGKLIKGINRGK